MIMITSNKYVFRGLFVPLNPSLKDKNKLIYNFKMFNIIILSK
jgi:hypothetical protein